MSSHEEDYDFYERYVTIVFGRKLEKKELLRLARKLRLIGRDEDRFMKDLKGGVKIPGTSGYKLIKYNFRKKQSWYFLQFDATSEYISQYEPTFFEVNRPDESDIEDFEEWAEENDVDGDPFGEYVIIEDYPV